ncbi:class I SAM-dependent methyltransferase [Clostridium sp.]|uniref:class I SAM-dependent methyltransferase n=1 Tax=Clostridium sp. TaxID=1506 RepID=UPI003F2E0DE1
MNLKENDQRYDEKLGIITYGYKKTNNKKSYANYDATPYQVLEYMTTYYPFDKDDYFVDFGCGLGRVICFVALNGCKNVIGIEVNKEIFEQLEKNVEKNKHKGNIEIINQCAEKALINPRVNKCFFYNPFYLKHFIKVFYNLISQTSEELIYIFLYDAAIEYIKFLDTQNNVKLDRIINFTGGAGDLFIYKIERTF